MVLEDEAIQTENMFSKCLGIKYAKEFYKVFHDSFETKEEGMKHIYQMAKSDGDLTDNQKKLVRTCFIGFIQAMCKDTISIPLIGFVSSKKPNLSTLSYCTQETVDKYPWILDCARNYIKMINYIVVLEHNRLKEVNSTSH